MKGGPQGARLAGASESKNTEKNLGSACRVLRAGVTLQASRDRSLETLGIQSCLPRFSCYFHTMTLTELPQVQALSAREKLELVDEIWRSLSTSPDYLEVTQEEKDILDIRWEEFLSNPTSALSIDVFKSKIHAIRA